MQTGVVKFFNEDKGFGFITNDMTNEDIFVHITGLRSKNIEQGNKVSYSEEKGKKGLIATDVTIIED
ncbi:cold-shock protein [Myroides sp. LJL115]